MDDDPAKSELASPLELIKSETIPPSPGSSIDCLLNYSNFSWIAYGASSLLVISHIPSPTSPSPSPSLIGIIYRQVIQLPSSSPIKSLSWSPSLPSSNAEIAAAVDNLICLYADFSSGPGSFDWTQVAVLVQCHTIDALKWTNSGDGLVTVGVEVVLWKRKHFQTWELAWKLKPNHPHTMVTATWSTQGPVASSSSSSTDVNTCVLVCQMDDKSEFIRRSELRHPQPVFTIQWRPSDSHRDVLLTCCVDGTARLWVEIDTGRAKNSKQYYHVISVIEINHTLNGTLGVDTFLTWVTEITSTTTLGGRAKREGSAHVIPGACEWLIGYGPHMLLTFWAVHCLDDTSPLRFPRVTLWKTLDMAGEEGRYLQTPGNFNSKDHSVFIKAVVSRNQLHGPPAMCSLLQLLSDNSICWSYLPTLESSNTLGDSFSLDGHSGNILQVDIHPYSCEVELAVSLDSNGLLLFWSFSTFSSSIIGMPARLLPNWKLVGKMATKQLYCVEYSSLRWVPSVSNGQCVLLLGHPIGIDCFTIEIAKSQAENIACHKLCTIPFTGHKHADAPTSIYASPLPCTCRKSFISNRFMLLGVWTSKFQALSWRVTLHSADSSESCCDCNFDVRGDAAELDGCRYESSFAGRRYCLVTEPCSSKLPDSPIFDQVTSVAAVPPGSLMPSVQRNWPTSNGVPCKTAPFQLATGHSDGSLRLWRSSCSKSLTPCSESWELVGMFNAHQERIAAISLSCSGGKIATVSLKNCQEDVAVLCIWQPIHIMDVGSFLLEDQICLNGVVVAMNWFSIGNGQLLLGVCMKNELRIYAQKRCRSQTLVDSGEPLATHIWCCIATNTTSITALDFIWGPGATPVLVHEKYFSLFSKWSFHMDKKYQPSFCAQLYEENASDCVGETDKELFATVFSDCSSCKINTLSSNWITKRCNSDMPSKLSAKSDHPVDSLFSTTGEPQYTSGKCFRSILEVAGEIRRSLPIYHPEALLLNLFSGNWRRACVALRHLVGHLTSNNTYVSSGKTHDHVPNKGIPQILLSKYYGEPYSVAVGDEELTWGVGTASVSSLRFQQNSINSFGYNEDDNGPNNRVTPGSGKSEISGFIETIEKCTDIPSITNLERRKMLAVTDLLLEIGDSSCASAYESLDEPARRFWVELKFQQHFLRRFGGLEATNVLVAGSVMIGWAFLSDCQDNLITSVLPNEPSWQDMRNLGAGFWFRNTTQLRTRMEKLARSQYLKKRDPKDCALLYIALNRLQVLAGLFKVSRDEKDKPLVGFLSRNFQDEKNKAAALKNAYVLMGRHQLELAIAFFLLGGDTSSAVSVCAKTLGDEQLALVICRLMEGNGGPLERHLITKILLPASIDRGDCWLASLFEWTLGNYFPSLLRLLGHAMDGMDVGVDWSVLLSSRSAFLDPKIGQYCLVLATTPFMKNYIGESAAGLLTRWATLMTSTALHRRGMPVEALQSLSFSLGSIEIKDDGISTDLERHRIPHRILTHNDASNWLSGDVSLHVESNFKLDLALHSISYMVVEHPIWLDVTLSSLKPLVCNKYTSSQYKISLVNFQHKLNSELTTFEQKYSLDFLEMLNMILVYSCNHGLSFIGYHMLHGYTSPEFSRDEDCSVDSIFQYLSLPELFLRASEEVLCFFTRYLICCSVIYPPPHSSFPIPKRSNANRSRQLYLWDVYMKRSLQLLESLRAILKMYYPSFLSEDLMTETCTCIDLVEYYLVFTSAWRHKNLRRLILIIQPLLVAYNDGHIPWKVGVENLKKHLCENLVLLTCDSSIDDVEGTPMLTCKQGGDEISAALLESIPDDEKWLILGTCLWRHLFNFTRDLVKSYPDNLTTCRSSKSLLGAIFSSTDGNESCDSEKKCTNDGFMQAPLLFVNSLNNALATIASSHERQLASVLGLKLELGVYVPSLVWLDNTSHSHSSSSSKFLKQDVGSLMSNEEEFFRVLWEISVDAKEVCKFLPQDNMSRKLSKGWTDLRKGSWNKLERDDTLNEVQGATGEGVGRYPPDNGVFLKSRSNNSTIVKDVTLFQNPEEIYKRNGELLEVICLNSINQHQAAVASNRKGILFFNWKEEELSNEHSEYIWSVADWPQNGWAGSESTPVATFVSQGIGLGSNKGTHLGLGGATVGMGEGAFGSSELGWGTQEDFEFDDPPATVDNISTRALCSHPARPLFLAGSSNTHIYLWEFGKYKSVATYGVLPAANVPPPYALASIEALQFDNYGHRFATAALDGTICTWQLEVGGRSNVHPTESSLCFNRHALDVTYVGASGSVIAAAGYSSDDVNVVIWDTLAPPTTSQASLMCHQGGARSVSVFEKNIGSGSISPLIVTGGRGGDIGLHDFRFIATGKSKQQHHKGMLWYIPKAHVGSVTRIAVIPDSSFFLTGGKDGDVKLWDANKSQLVFHWPKLHERHTFLQPTSRGFGGIVRAAVTDIQVVSNGFLTCGGDGTVKMVLINNFVNT